MTISTESLAIPLSPCADELVTKGDMLFQEQSDSTICTLDTETDVKFGNVIVSVQDFEQITGMSLETWWANVMTIEGQRVHCRIGSVALCLSEFEESHQNIQLGQE